MRLPHIHFLIFALLALSRSLASAGHSTWGYLIREGDSYVVLLIGKNIVRSDAVVSNLEQLRRNKGAGPVLHLVTNDEGTRKIDAESAGELRRWQHGSTEWVPTNSCVPATITPCGDTRGLVRKKLLLPHFGIDPLRILVRLRPESELIIDFWPRWSQSHCFRTRNGTVVLVANNTLLYVLTTPPELVQVKREFRDYLLPKRVGQNPLLKIPGLRGLSAACCDQDTVAFVTSDGYLVTYDVVADEWGSLVRPFAGSDVLSLHCGGGFLRALLDRGKGTAIARASVERLTVWTEEMSGPDLEENDRICCFCPGIAVTLRGEGKQRIVTAIRDDEEGTWRETVLFHLAENESLLDCKVAQDKATICLLIGKRHVANADHGLDVRTVVVALPE